MSEINWLGCNSCKHKNKGESKCSAFPEGIPFPIANGSLAHTSKMFGQKSGIVFERLNVKPSSN